LGALKLAAIAAGALAAGVAAVVASGVTLLVKAQDIVADIDLEQLL